MRRQEFFSLNIFYDLTKFLQAEELRNLRNTSKKLCEIVNSTKLYYKIPFYCSNRNPPWRAQVTGSYIGKQLFRRVDGFYRPICKIITIELLNVNITGREAARILFYSCPTISCFHLLSKIDSDFNQFLSHIKSLCACYHIENYAYISIKELALVIGRVEEINEKLLECVCSLRVLRLFVVSYIRAPANLLRSLKHIKLIDICSAESYYISQIAGISNTENVRGYPQLCQLNLALQSNNIQLGNKIIENYMAKQGTPYIFCQMKYETFFPFLSKYIDYQSIDDFISMTEQNNYTTSLLQKKDNAKLNELLPSFNYYFVYHKYKKMTLYRSVNPKGFLYGSEKLDMIEASPPSVYQSNCVGSFQCNYYPISVQFLKEYYNVKLDYCQHCFIFETLEAIIEYSKLHHEPFNQDIYRAIYASVQTIVYTSKITLEQYKQIIGMFPYLATEHQKYLEKTPEFYYRGVPIPLLIFEKKYTEIMKYFIDTQLNFRKITDINGWTIMHIVSTYADSSLIDSILKLGGRVNCYDTKGNSPLHIASHSCNYECVKVLLENGARVTKNNDGKYPSPNSNINVNESANVQKLLSSACKCVIV